jgi:hypothetical protein
MWHLHDGEYMLIYKSLLPLITNSKDAFFLFLLY